MTAHPPFPQARTVTLAVLTYQRNDNMVRAVESMVACAVPAQNAPWRLLEILVVDNNPDGMAKPTVAALQEAHDIDIRYVHEPAPGIVAARNRALNDARGQVLVFIDDDEIALPGWPHGLLQVMTDTGAALVGGPALTEFEQKPPDWAASSEFFKPAEHDDGAARNWLSTCNLAIDLDQINDIGLRYNPRFPHGEDVAFSRQAAHRGLQLRWSATAKVKEFVGPERTTLAWRRHRQRISTNSWVRASLDMDSSIRSKIVLNVKALARFAEAIGVTAFGVLRRDRGRLYDGLILFSHVQGSVDAMVAHHRPGHRQSESDPSAATLP